VLMYADRRTEAMETAIAETDRRREIQTAYNAEHGITPASIRKGISDIVELLGLKDADPGGPKRGRRSRPAAAPDVSAEELERLIVDVEGQMLEAAEELRFEAAAELRDELAALRRDLAEREGMGPMAEAAAGDGDEAARHRPGRGPAPVPRKSRPGAGGRRRR